MEMVASYLKSRPKRSFSVAWMSADSWNERPPPLVESSPNASSP
jgi:hypothetical protein